MLKTAIHHKGISLGMTFELKKNGLLGSEWMYDFMQAYIGMCVVTGAWMYDFIQAYIGMCVVTSAWMYDFMQAYIGMYVFIGAWL